MATTSANNVCSYYEIYFSHMIKEYVDYLHEYNCIKFKWDYKPLTPGCYGYDNLALSAFYVCKYLENNDIPNDKTILSKIVHNAWVENYLYWTINKPYETNNLYKKPYKPLNDDNRNLLSTLLYDELPDSEKQKDDIIVDAILKFISISI